MKKTSIKMMGILSIICIMLLLILGSFGCKTASATVSSANTASATAVNAENTTLQKILETKVVKIGIITVSPPYCYLDENNNPTGFEPKVANELGKALVGEDGKVELVDLLAQNRIPALQTGEVDVGVFVMGNNPERAKLVMYSTYPYMVNKTGYVASKDLKIEGFEDLSGLKVGITKGSSDSITLAERGPKDVIVQNFDDDILKTNALLVGQVDAIAMIDALAAEVIKENPDKNLEWKFTHNAETEHIMVRLHDYDLMGVVDSFILKSYTSGDLGMWWDEYMDFPFGDLPTLATPLVPNGGSAVFE